MENKLFQCPDCGNEEAVMDDAVEVEGGDRVVCRMCAHNYSECSFCGDMCSDGSCCDGCGDYYCSSHVCENCDNEATTRPWIRKKEWISEKDGKIVPAIASVGVEIECVAPSIIDVAEKVHTSVGLCEDGSISGNGVELVTPPCRGEGVEKMLKSVTEALRKSHARVNSSCGLHIHIDGTKLLETPRAIPVLMAEYIVFEDVIMSFLPPSRRANHYASSLRMFTHLDEITKLGSSISKMEALWYRDNQDSIEVRKMDKYDGTRYRGLNLHPLFAEGHYEVRYHSGTINEEKITRWIGLHLSMLREAIASVEVGVIGGQFAFFNQILSETSLVYKTNAFFDHIKAPQELRSFYIERQRLLSRDLGGYMRREEQDLTDLPMAHVGATDEETVMDMSI